MTSSWTPITTPTSFSDTHQWTLTLDSMGRWYLYLDTSARATDAFGGESPRQTGTVPPLRTGAGDFNDVMLAFTGSTGTLTVNGVWVADLDLAACTEAGQVSIATQVRANSGQAGAATRYKDFTITP